MATSSSNRPSRPPAGAPRGATPTALTKDAVLARLRQLKPDLAARYHIRSLGLFGSYARGTQTRRSDLDILVSFVEPPSLFTFLRLKREIEQHLGLRVDLVMREALRPAIGRRILAEVTDA
jgi:predicted nucleotidyltransferase